ncbi:MAG: FtsW/RodA/SpoVE family cell cycle protein, partial [Mycobacterium sp.]
LPVTGLQLPLISAGGTSTATTLLMIGIMANAARHEPEAVAALRAGRDDRVNRLLRLPLPAPYVPTRTEALRDRLRTRGGKGAASAKQTKKEARPRASAGASKAKAPKAATSRSRKPATENRRQTATAARAVRAPRHHGDGRVRKGRGGRTLEGQHYG